MGDMRARLAAMRSGELAAAVTSLQEAYEIQDNGQGTVIATFADVVPHFHTHVIFARDALIKNNPDLVRRFLKGWFTVAAYMRDHRAEAVKSAAETMKLDAKVINETYPIEISGMNFDGSFDPAALEVIRSSLKDLGILDTAPPVSAMLAPGSCLRMFALPTSAAAPFRKPCGVSQRFNAPTSLRPSVFWF